MIGHHQRSENLNFSDGEFGFGVIVELNVVTVNGSTVGKSGEAERGFSIPVVIYRRTLLGSRPVEGGY